VTFPLLFSKNTNRNNWGSVIIGFAIIFIGLDFLNHSTPDINSNPEILRFLTDFSNYGYFSILLFVLIGAILTMIIQSSSATIALTLVMCFNGWIAFDMAAAMVLGQNIGTTITANLAALVANTSGKRTAMAHLFFNVLGVVLILPVFYPFLHLVSRIAISNGLDSPLAIVGQTPQETAAAIPIALSIFHTIFNILNTFILIWFVKPLEKIIIKIIKQKDDDEEFKLQYISTGLLSTIDLSILQARKELMGYTERVETMFIRTIELLTTTSSKKISSYQDKIRKNEEASDQYEVEITAYLAEVSMQELSRSSVESINRMLQITTQIESIADSCYSISRTIGRKTSNKIKFNEDIEENLISFSQKITEQFDMMIEVIKDPQIKIDLEELKALTKDIHKKHEQLQQGHFKNLRKGKYKTKVGVMYADIYTELMKIGDMGSYVVGLLACPE
jgi:phosphate:Na+ symporter